tara:strand:- start:417 stop:680 length:264 start_codon:yes stop_codon:yes gene_type:complete
MINKETLFNRAISGNFDTDNLILNMNRCREIANGLRFTDIIQGTSRHIGLMAELLYRVRHMPDIEYIDFETILKNYEEASGGSRKGD